MKLGMFDAPERVRWAQIPFSVLDQPAHRELARQVARESIVLLKNERNTLPLRKDLRTIAVIGPNADQWRMLLGNYNGIPKLPVTPLLGIRDALQNSSTRVVYALGSDLAEGFPVLSSMPSTVLRTPDDKPGLRAEYFASKAMDGAPVYSAADTVVEADWAEAAPRPDLNANDFGVRWSGTFTPRVTGAYRLGVIGTMRVQLFLDDSVVARSVYPQRDNEFPDPRLSQTDPARPLQLEGGHSYRLRLEAAETYGEAQAQLVWAPPSGPLEEAALAAAQQRLLESVVAVGKPTVLVLMNGSALSVNWAQQHVPAIIEAWYPGQAGGSAIADVLFGDYNPAGRLPVTFYKDVKDIPPFEDYTMAGRTYRFFDGTPLYPFGHGLSYTTFAYANLRTTAASVPATGAVTVRVDVTNTGTRAGDEVVQLYAQHMGSKVPRARKELRGYKRVTLQPGVTKTVQLSFPVSSLAYWNAGTRGWIVESEPVKLQVGASSADVRLDKTIRVVGGRVRR
jgi:beta-glucosidase